MVARELLWITRPTLVGPSWSSDLMTIRTPLRSRPPIQLLCSRMPALYPSSWEVDVTLIEDWLTALSEDDYDLVLAALELLAPEGPSWKDWYRRSIPLADRLFDEHKETLGGRKKS